MHRLRPYWWLALVLGLVVVWTPAAVFWLDRAPLTYRNVPFPVLNSPLQPGQMLVLSVDRCVEGGAPLPYTFTRSLVEILPDGADGRYVVLPAGGSLAPPGCLAVESLSNVIPQEVRPGHYELRALTSVSGHFRTFNVPWSTEPFDVVAP